MSLEYELIVTCAIAALAIMFVFRQRRRIRALRDRHQSHPTTPDRSADETINSLTEGDGSDDASQSAADRQYYRIIVTILVLALIWFGYRIWTDP